MMEVRKSGFLRTIPLLITILFLSFPAYAKYSGGTGEPNDPYQIATAEDLMLLGESPDDYDKNFILTADVDLDPKLPGRKVFDKAVIAPDNDRYYRFLGTVFSGFFDGNGHVISNLHILGSRCVGLFGRLHPGMGIYNLGLEAVDINGVGDHVGGLVGYNQHGSITACYSTGTVTGNEFVGGLVGHNEDGSIIASYSTGTVSGDYYVGGLVGINSGRIFASYSTGTVSGDRFTGGLVGYNGGSIVASFWDIDTSGQTSSAGGMGLTTAEMQDVDIFLTEGWDFVGETSNGTSDYWQISPGDYPKLRYHDGNGPVMPDGLGTEEHPYLIRDAQDLGTMWFESSAHYRLEASLDLSEITWSMAVVPWFEGTFDGNGYVISNLHIEGGDYLGLFGRLISGAKISNLGLEAVDVNGTGGSVGSLSGSNEGSIATSYSTGTVSGDYYVGGLVGHNIGSINTSYSICTVRGDQCVGGLLGTNSSSSDLFVVDGILANCYSTGKVSGNRIVGGLVGRNGGSSITTSYSTGTVSGSEYVGGLIGENLSGIVATSFWDIETSGFLTSEEGIGKTTSEMQTASTFLDAGWDFVDETENGTEDIWWILEGEDYPRLWWERSTDDLFFLVVDDFESYNERIFWIDGWGTLTNGSTVSELCHIDPYFNPDLLGFNVPGVHGGEWSMVCFYDNTTTKYSEATKTLVWPRNWKQDGVGVLSLWFNGDPANDPEPMYVAVANYNSPMAVVYHNNPEALLKEEWIEWRIDLQVFADQGVNLTNINSITIGFGNRSNPVAGGSGLMYFDDIRLYRPTSVPAP